MKPQEQMPLELYQLCLKCPEHHFHGRSGHCHASVRACRRKAVRQWRREHEIGAAAPSGESLLAKRNGLEHAEMRLGRALRIVKRLQEVNDGSPVLAELRGHLEGALKGIRKA